MCGVYICDVSGVCTSDVMSVQVCQCVTLTQTLYKGQIILLNQMNP